MYNDLISKLAFHTKKFSEQVGWIY